MSSSIPAIYGKSAKPNNSSYYKSVYVFQQLSKRLFWPFYDYFTLNLYK